MRTTIEFAVTHGMGGNAAKHQLYGWSTPENGFTWAIGPESAVVVPMPKAPNGCFVEISAYPFVVRDAHPIQRLIVKVNGRAVGDLSLRWRGTWALYVPATALGGDNMVITLEHPDAARPSDFGTGKDGRELAVAVGAIRVLSLAEPWPCFKPRSSAVTFDLADDVSEGEVTCETERAIGVPAVRLVTHFESIGDNCEFGLFQRRCGAEPLGLLRFSTALLQPVTRGIDCGFAGLGAPDQVDPQLDGNGRGEWIVYENQYGLRYHTFIWEDQATRGQIHAQEITKLAFLRRKLMEDVAEGRKIFVHKRAAAPLCMEEVMPLFLALNRHAPNKLLWVQLADSENPAGTVEELLPGLMRGFIDRFAPGEMVPQLSVSGWAQVCANAWMLHPKVEEVMP
jgi:hypothetical protein